MMTCKAQGITPCGLSKKKYVKGYCCKHYEQVRKHGHVITTRNDPRQAIIDGGVAKIPLGLNAKDGYTLVDAEYANLDKHNWRLDRSGRVVTWQNVGGKKTLVLLHRLICPTGKQVDHVNGNPLDNRRSNLRPATHGQNQMNKGRAARNKSGYKGVSWHKQQKKWRANICKDRVRIHIGTFKDKIEAAYVWNQFAEQLHGEFARLNNV